MKRILKSGPVKAAALLCMGMLAMSGCQEPPTPASLLQEVSENMASVGSYAANMLVEMEVTGAVSYTHLQSVLRQKIISGRNKGFRVS